MRTKAATLLLSSSLLFAAGCASGDTESTPAASSNEPSPNGSEVAEETSVPELLQFTAPAVGGGEIDATTFAGKPTVFWFWAPT